MTRAKYFLLILLGILLHHKALAQTTARLTPFGLAGKKVTALALAQQVSPSGPFFYAATSAEGVWRYALAQSDTAWESIGLEHKEIFALDIHVWGAGPAIFHAPVAGVAPKFIEGDSTVVYRYEQEQWRAADLGITRDGFHGVRALASFESSGHMPPGAAFAAGGEFVHRAQTNGTAWQEAFRFGLGSTNALAVKRSEAITEVWAGGVAAIFTPWIARSKDEGATWEVLPVINSVSGENVCQTIALHPSDSNVVYVGMQEEIVKTNDGGKTWRALLQQRAASFYAVKIDVADPEHIYAGGTIADPNTWALWESFDAGATWREIFPPEGRGEGRGIRSLVVDPNQAGVVYIATAGYGVWKYQSAPTNVNDPPQHNLPQGFALAQNVPNPFSLAEAQATVIRYQLPSAQQIKVEIYDLLGKRVATLIDRVQASGEHTVAWNGKDLAGKLVPNGIYFYRLSAGGSAVLTRKMVVWR